MREWLSGRASPCQGERREFESRLPLHFTKDVLQNASFDLWRHSQEVRQRSATPLSPVQIWLAPPHRNKFCLFRFLFCKKQSRQINLFWLFFIIYKPRSSFLYCDGVLPVSSLNTLLKYFCSEKPHISDICDIV